MAAVKVIIMVPLVTSYRRHNQFLPTHSYNPNLEGKIIISSKEKVNVTRIIAFPTDPSDLEPWTARPGSHSEHELMGMSYLHGKLLRDTGLWMVQLLSYMSPH